jgi:hypothetical protein
MLVRRTEKGLTELRSRERTLGLRERSVLFLADGRKTLSQLAPALVSNGGADVLRALVDGGYLEVAPGPAAPPPPAVIGAPAPASPQLVARPQPPAAHSVDTFEGKRSLATTRMFLFDLCERMFVRRSPQLAAQFRDGLREARDRETMLQVSRRMLEEIEAAAGADRADAISERIAMLLPAE